MTISGIFSVVSWQLLIVKIANDLIRTLVIWVGSDRSVNRATSPALDWILFRRHSRFFFDWNREVSFLKVFSTLNFLEWLEFPIAEAMFTLGKIAMRLLYVNLLYKRTLLITCNGTSSVHRDSIALHYLTTSLCYKVCII